MNIRFSELASRYDVFFFDLWGVTHNGRTPFPGALETFQRLFDQEKTIFFLSNAPRTRVSAEGRLASLGIPLYNGVYTSGEECSTYLRDRSTPFYQSLKGRFFFVGQEADVEVTKKSSFERTHSLTHADFILVSGVDRLDDFKSYYDPLIHEALILGLPMICVNSDRVAMVEDDPYPCAGALAELYENAGGYVYWHGKPSSTIYASAHRLVDENCAKNRILMVGDSLRTDITGAHTYGIDSVLVLSGVHQGHDLKKAYETYGVEPTYLMPSVQW